MFCFLALVGTHGDAYYYLSAPATAQRTQHFLRFAVTGFRLTMQHAACCMLHSASRSTCRHVATPCPHCRCILRRARVGATVFVRPLRMMVPAATPRAIIQRLNSEVNTLGYEIAGGAPQPFGDWLRRESVKWHKVIRDNQITACVHPIFVIGIISASARG